VAVAGRVIGRVRSISFEILWSVAKSRRRDHAWSSRLTNRSTICGPSSRTHDNWWPRVPVASAMPDSGRRRYEVLCAYPRRPLGSAWSAVVIEEPTTR
jgi:hypothetical protein